MGRGAGGDSGRLLDRLNRRPGHGPPGWSDGDGTEPDVPAGETDPFPAGVGGDASARRVERGRHVDGAPAAGGAGWRVSGVPPGLAVLLLLVAVVAVVLFGRGGGPDEVLVGPAGADGAALALQEGAAGGPADPDGAGGDGAGGDVGGVVDAAPGGLLIDETPVGGPVPGHGVDGAAGPRQQAGAAGAAGAPMLVHVDGAVHRPGVVEVPAGARVGDAVAAAGGTTDDADTRLVNLARPLADGELVVVPRPGEVVAAPGAAGGPDAGAGGPAAPDPAGGRTAGSSALVDLNTADAAALDELPGIGPVLAERIVTWRAESGPFVAVDDLTSVSGIGPAVMADIRDLVTV